MENNFDSTYVRCANRMEKAALILGAISLATVLVVYISVVCGALAILFALLSRGQTMRMHSRAMTGLILGILGISLSVLLFCATFIFIINRYGSLENMLKAYCDMLGLDYNELYGNFFRQ